MTRSEAVEKQIEDIMDSFDFAKCATCMEAINWEIAIDDHGLRVPSEFELRKIARERLREAAQRRKGSHSGCFRVEYHEGNEHGDTGKPWVWLILAFCFVSWPEGETYDP